MDRPMGMNAPLFCDIGITERCLFKCKMCKIWEMPSCSQELSIGEWKNFIASLEEFGSHNIRLHFAGGEPLLKEGILDIIGFAHKKGFTTVMVSNGFLIDESMAAEIADSGLDVISLSLDSLDASIHDFLRGVSGAHRQIMQALGYLKKHNSKSISLLAVIMALNLDGLLALADWANENETISSIYFQAISQPIAMPKDHRWHNKEEFHCLWPKDYLRIESVIGGLINNKKNGYKISNSFRQLEMFKSYFKNPQTFSNGLACNQGDYVMYIRPTGDVFLCGSLAAVGNVKADNIIKIWHSSQALAARKQIYKCQESCLNLLNCFENKELL